MTTRNLVSPVIIRPKHGAFKGVPLVAVEGSSCHRCVGDGDGECLLFDFACDPWHYEHAEVRDDKR